MAPSTPHTPREAVNFGTPGKAARAGRVPMSATTQRVVKRPAIPTARSIVDIAEEVVDERVEELLRQGTNVVRLGSFCRILVVFRCMF